MDDCKNLKTKDVTLYHGDVYDHPDYEYICEKCGRPVIPFLHCNSERCEDYENNGRLRKRISTGKL